jgi:hypothetical protein
MKRPLKRPFSYAKLPTQWYWVIVIAIEARLFRNPKMYVRFESFSKYLDTKLLQYDFNKYERDVAAAIAAWPDNEVDSTDKTIIRCIMDNVIARTRDGYSKDSITTNKLIIMLNLEVAKKIVTTLNHIISLQPMSSPVGLVYMMQLVSSIVDSSETRRIALEIVPTTVEAASRQLSAQFSFEAMRDLKSMHALDIEHEIKQLATSEIGDDIIREVFNDLIKLAIKIDVTEEKLLDDIYIKGVENGNALLQHIADAAKDIGDTTFRGIGNFIIAPPIAIALLQSATSSKFESSKQDASIFPSRGIISYCGNIVVANTRVNVYASTEINDIIIGFKGSTTDAGYVLCPYIPVVSKGVSTNPRTFQPVLGFMTRYGKTLNGNQKHAENYYRVLKL